MNTTLPLYSRAVALGVGLALACSLTPSLAFADPAEASSTSNTASASQSASAGEANQQKSSSSSAKDEAVVPGVVVQGSGQTTAEQEAQAAAAAAAAAETQARLNQVAAVFAQVDAYQTRLNDANKAYEDATAAYEQAVAEANEAQAKIDEQAARVNELKTSVSNLMVEMYKRDSGNEYLFAVLGNGTLEEMITSMEALGAVSGKQVDLLREAREVRTNYELAKETLRVKTEEAEREQQAAADAQAQAEAAYKSLMDEASRLSGDLLGDSLLREYSGNSALQAETTRRAVEDALKRGNLRISAGTSTLLENPCPTATDSSGFGYRDFDNSFHAGLDMAAGEGTPYYAAESGTVIYATNDNSYNGGAGNWVVISHGSGIVTKYMHSLTTLVKPGDRVVRGQLIGLVGNTGQSFGAHLHFQVELDGNPIDPRNFI